MNKEYWWKEAKQKIEEIDEAVVEMWIQFRKFALSQHIPQSTVPYTARFQHILEEEYTFKFNLVRKIQESQEEHLSVHLDLEWNLSQLLHLDSSGELR